MAETLVVSRRGRLRRRARRLSRALERELRNLGPHTGVAA
jgi:hypothetical protein